MRIPSSLYLFHCKVTAVPNMYGPIMHVPGTINFISFNPSATYHTPYLRTVPASASLPRIMKDPPALTSHFMSFCLTSSSMLDIILGCLGFICIDVSVPFRHDQNSVKSISYKHTHTTCIPAYAAKRMRLHHIQVIDKILL